MIIAGGDVGTPLGTKTDTSGDRLTARRRRVALVTQDYQIGGAELQVEIAAVLLAERLGGCDMIGTRPVSQATASVAGVRRHRIGARRRHTLWRLTNLCTAFAYFAWHGHRYAVVHGYCLSTLVLGALLGGKMRGCRTVLRVCTVGPQGEIGKIKYGMFGTLLWRLFLQADAFAATTPGIAAALQSNGVPANKITVLPSVITTAAPLPAGRSAARQALQLPEQCTVLFVGRWVSQKRIPILLEAWRILAPSDATLVLVGDGPERTQIERWVQHAVCARSVRLYGWQEHPERFYHAADIFAFTAHHEAFGNVVAEAMTHGLAVLATRTGLVPYWIENGVNGIIVNDDTPEEVAGALAALLSDASLRRRLGEAARRTALEAFEPAAVIDQQLALYTRLLDGESAPSAV